MKEGRKEGKKERKKERLINIIARPDEVMEIQFEYIPINVTSYTPLTPYNDLARVFPADASHARGTWGKLP